MPKPSFQPFGFVHVFDKASPLETNPGVGPVPLPVIPTNEIFEGGTGGAVVDHLFLFTPTDTIGLLGVALHDPLG